MVSAIIQASSLCNYGYFDISTTSNEAMDHLLLQMLQRRSRKCILHTVFQG
jgi:hypothetical protein